MTGCGFVYALAKVFSDIQLGKIIAVIGDYSFSIMLLHFLSFKLVNYIFCEYHGLELTNIAAFPTVGYSNIAWFFMYLLAGVFVPVLLSKCFHICKGKLVS
jgi:fucose 4-O-acetylase-like acetyltransferase